MFLHNLIKQLFNFYIICIKNWKISTTKQAINMRPNLTNSEGCSGSGLTHCEAATSNWKISPFLGNFHKICNMSRTKEAIDTGSTLVKSEVCSRSSPTHCKAATSNQTFSPFLGNFHKNMQYLKNQATY